MNSLSALSVVLSLAVVHPLPSGAAETLTPPRLATPYGNDESAGQFTTVNGIKLYFEIHGDGPPMLQIHGNGENISALGHQIEFFSARYRVVVADSRGHGKSAMGPDRLTYEQMAEDANALRSAGIEAGVCAGLE
jgi:alpha-beta hydrolase superfamily lysophospholipase